MGTSLFDSCGRRRTDALDTRRARSREHHLGSGPPVLLIHGDDDRNVAFSQTVELARKLRERGVKFEQLVFSDEVHDFLLHENWLKIYQATADFFDRQFKP